MENLVNNASKDKLLVIVKGLCDEIDKETERKKKAKELRRKRIFE